MIKCMDFVPEQLDAGGFLRAAEHEKFGPTIARANAWITENAINVLNVETVVLPNIHLPHEEGSGDTNLHSSGDMSTAWNQFIRVWYRD